MRQVKEVHTSDGTRYRVRYRLGGRETSETFLRRPDAEMFRDILGDGSGDRVTQALAWLRAQQTGPTSSLTFGQWFDAYVTQLTGVTPRTREDYRSIRRRYLSHLDQTPLTMLGRAHVTGLVNDMEAAGRAPKTIKQTVHLLSTCLALAIDEGHLTANPCKRVRLPTASLDTVDPRFLTTAEFAALVAATPAHYKPLVTFLFGTGMRWSEATGIEGRHIDLEAGTVRVDQAWKRVPGDGFRLGPPKTPRARRTVYAAEQAIEAVRPLLGGPRELVFRTASGGPVSHANFYNNIWTKTCERAGLDPAPRIHDARHTHASWLLSDGVSLEAVQDQLGHESIETTRRVYAHLIPAVGERVRASATLVLRGALPA